MKKFLRLALIAPFIFGCSNKTSYVGEKILTIEHDDSGELFAVTLETMYQIAVYDKKDSIFYIGDESCSACLELKIKLGTWMKSNLGKIYFISYRSINENNVDYLEDATVGYYQWNPKSTIPSVYFFTNGGAIFMGDETNTMNYLNRYVGVESA